MGGSSPTSSLQDRYRQIIERIRQATERSDRPASSVRLLAVTKTVDVDRIKSAVSLGMKDFGENRVQEAEAKRNDLIGLPGLTHHLIGQLQTNKARRAVELFDVIQSVDRIKLAETLDRVAGELGKRQRCLAEIKIASEETKSGVPLEEAAEFIGALAKFKNLKLEGLMTIGTHNASPEETRSAFRAMANFFQTQRGRFGEAPMLSMGMSDDFEIAIEEGSTLVRIGRALFGERA